MAATGHPKMGISASQPRSATKMKISSHAKKAANLQHAVPIIENRLYFFATRYRPKSDANVHFFTIDNILRYEPFFVDFGPLNLACLYKFCGLLKHKLKDPRYNKARIYYYCEKDPQRIANAAYLIGAFEVIELNRYPSIAYDIVKSIAIKAVPFRDASMGLCTYRCTVEHTLWAIYRAKQRKFLDFSTFNVDEYQYYERVECGDLNIMVPNKFLAFAGPHYKEFDEEGYPALTPHFYLPIWKKFGVTTIVRLNKKCYDKRIWSTKGYDHHDLYFIDGTTPNDEIINKFLEICENAKGVCAIHCKAGLGRTGSLLGCYFMKHYCWTAFECIAWLRICRPGSVIGPQQHFLEKQQPIMWAAGDSYRKKHGIKLEFDPRIEKQEMEKQRAEAARLQQKEFTERFMQQQQQFNSTPHRNMNNNNKNLEEKSSDTDMIKQQSQQHQPLATDPGQDQGGALQNAKRYHKHDNIPQHLYTPTGSQSDLRMNGTFNDNGNNNNNNGNNNINNNLVNGHSFSPNNNNNNNGRSKHHNTHNSHHHSHSHHSHHSHSQHNHSNSSSLNKQMKASSSQGPSVSSSTPSRSQKAPNNGNQGRH